VINALLMFATAAVGFAGVPWAGFAVGASAILVLGLPAQLDVLKRYRGQAKTDIILIMLFRVGVAAFGAFASAWVGYGLRLLLQVLKS